MTLDLESVSVPEGMYCVLPIPHPGCGSDSEGIAGPDGERPFSLRQGGSFCQRPPCAGRQAPGHPPRPRDPAGSVSPAAGFEKADEKGLRKTKEKPEPCHGAQVYFFEMGTAFLIRWEFVSFSIFPVDISEFPISKPRFPTWL